MTKLFLLKPILSVIRAKKEAAKERKAPMANVLSSEPLTKILGLIILISLSRPQ